MSKKCARHALGLPEHTNSCSFYNKHHNKEDSVTFLSLDGKADAQHAGDEGAAHGRAAADVFLAAIPLPQNILAASELNPLLPGGTWWLPVFGRG